MRNIEISTFHCPLTENQIKDIALLYGSNDAKYQTYSFVHQLYNENPFGHPICTFAKFAGKTIGFYSVIPVEVSAEGKTYPSVKGEGLVVAADFRRDFIKVDGKRVPIALALLTSTYNRAEEIGYPLIHMVGAPRLEGILKLAGCEKKEIQLSTWHFLLKPKTQTSKARKALEHWQNALLRLYCALSVTLKLPIIKTGFPKAPISGNSEGWEIAINQNYKTWMKENFSHIELDKKVLVFSLNKSSECSIEVVESDLNSVTFMTFFRIMVSLLEYAKKQNAAQIIFDDSTLPENNLITRFALVLLGFIKIKRMRPIYVRSNKKFGHWAFPIAYRPYLHAAF